MISAALLSIGLLNSAAVDLPLLPEAAAYVDLATEWLLDGRALPPDYRLKLLEMSPEARLQTIIFLRRAGLLTSETWPLQDILRAASKTEVSE